MKGCVCIFDEFGHSHGGGSSSDISTSLNEATSFSTALRRRGWRMERGNEEDKEGGGEEENQLFRQHDTASKKRGQGEECCPWNQE